jgi:hypothetical protein
MTRILFIGASWLGSSARSLREAIAMQPGVEISDIAEDHFIPNYRHVPLRIANRLLRPLQLRELKSAVLHALVGFPADVVLIYKGAGISRSLVEEIRQSGTVVINVFPDNSPHAFGKNLQETMGLYDLVISTKPYHPNLWKTVYGYSNPCVCVPHGYDPKVHYWPEPPPEPKFDLALCGTWRLEYHKLMRSLADNLGEERISVAIAGPGWEAKRSLLPPHWQIVGPRMGRAYGDFLRMAKIGIAPVNREMLVHGERQPGDEDTTRTYELAAAHCFFLHQRTDFVATVFDEKNEVPLWDDAAELAELVRKWLPDEAGRRRLAGNAHARAVPAYSIPQRAVSVLWHIGQCLKDRKTPQEKP